MSKCKIAAWTLGLVALAGCSALDPYADAKEAVRRLLKDPESAQFREVRRCSKPGGIWGEVNSKNSFGGYAGFVSFIYADGDAAILNDEIGSEDLAHWEALTKKCYSDESLNVGRGARKANGDIDATASELDRTANELEAAADAATNELRAGDR